MPSPADVDDHAIEMAVSRLRRSLTDAEVVQTVLRRGYRLGDRLLRPSMVKVASRG